MGRVLARTVYATRANGEIVKLSPGQVLPKEFEGVVTNPAAFAVEGVASAPDSAEPAGGYADLTVKELKALLKSRELPPEGNKGELVERLLEDDAERQDEPGQSDEVEGVASAPDDDLEDEEE